MHQSTTPSLPQTISVRWTSRQFLTLYIVQTMLLVTFDYSLSSEAVVMRQLRRWKRLWRRSLTRSHKWTSMGPSRSCLDGTKSALQRLLRRSLEFHVCTINKCVRTKSPEIDRIHLVSSFGLFRFLMMIRQSSWYSFMSVFLIMFYS